MSENIIQYGCTIIMNVKIRKWLILYHSSNKGERVNLYTKILLSYDRRVIDI